MSRIQRRDVKAARKAVECGDHWTGRFGSRWIEPGEPYVRLSLPPGADPWYSDRWCVLRLHPECFDWQTPALPDPAPEAQA